MIDDIQKRMDEYVEWLKDKTTLRQVNGGDWIEITTPFLDRHNDYLQIYARRENGKYTLTDDGYILEDLLHSGCALESPKRQALLKMTLAGFGVRQEGNRLEVQTSPNDFARRKHDLIQAMLAVNDMFYLARSTVESVFLEDVLAWLDINEIRFIRDVKFTGQSGFDHKFDFAIPKSRQSPERLARAINKPSRDTAEAFAFAWTDTREVRAPDSQAFALLNDQEQRISANVLGALESYGVRPILWSQRDAAILPLAA
jgi:hypothetical protein